jgi:bacteriocin-like protein
MKSAKKPSRKNTLKTKSNAKGPVMKELSEDQLEHVAGGMYDAFLKLQGVDAASEYKVAGTVQGGWDLATNKIA